MFIDPTFDENDGILKTGWFFLSTNFDGLYPALNLIKNKLL